jgi:DNA polymerase I-like protein with 3'-5' exonuclease and polymerase domains
MVEKSYTIVESESQLQDLKSYIGTYDYFAFDTETTGLNVRKDKVIGLSICGEVGTAYYLPLFTWNNISSKLDRLWKDEVFIQVLTMLQKKELLMWNASFDIRIVKNNFKIDLTESLLADIMLMKHTVEEEGNFGLKKVAIQYQEEIGLGGMEEAANSEQIHLKENVKKNGGSITKTNFEMYKADLDVMGLYACSDADLTMRLAELFRQKLETEGLEEFFYDKEVMPLYKYVTIPMESNGICLDLPLIQSTLRDIVIDMENLESSIITQLDAIPEVLAWKKASALEMFPPKTTGAFAQAVAEFFNLDLPKTPSGKYSITKKSLSSLPETGAKHFLEGVAEFNIGHASQIAWELFCKSGYDKINISSKLQMGQIVFNCLGIKPLSSTDKGSPQFDDSMIQHLADVEDIPWAKDLSNYNKLVKIKGTYIDRFLEAQEDGKYYFSYKQHGTISGRYSGDAQQLPRPKEEGELAPVVLKYNNVIRAFFVVGKGRAFIDDDYESLEPFCFAHISGDEGLRDIFRKGHDFYSSIAIPTEKLFQYSADKKAENYLGKLAKPRRQSAKAYALGVPYGMTDYALGMSLGISTKEAAVLIDGYLNGFPALKDWMEYSELQANIKGYVRSEAGRIRHLPKAKELYRVHKKQLLDFKYRQRLERKLSTTMEKHLAKAEVLKMYRDYKNSVNNSKNFQIQSFGASIINLACIAITREFKEKGIQGHVCAQIHDQAIFDVPEDRAEECKEIVQRLMENTTKLSLDLKAPPVVARNWKDGH